MSRVHDLIAVLADNPGTVMTAAKLAKAVKCEERDVNAALGNWIRAHAADTLVVKVATGLWKWDETRMNGARPVSGAPAPGTYAALETVGEYARQLTMPNAVKAVEQVKAERDARSLTELEDINILREPFTLIKRTGDTAVLQDINDESLWIARKA